MLGAAGVQRALLSLATARQELAEVGSQLDQAAVAHRHRAQAGVRLQSPDSHAGKFP